MPSASSIGTLQVTVLSSETQFPIPGANVQIYDPANPSEILADVSTNASGQTELLTLPTPPLSYSQSPGKPQPFADYSSTSAPPASSPCRSTVPSCLQTQCPASRCA